MSRQRAPRSTKERKNNLSIEAEFLRSASSFKDCPTDGLPEIAFVGRSNAGKSSTLNRLVGRRTLARVSKTPGRTQLLNFFNSDIGARLVDLPGYGYAKASRKQQAVWNTLVDEYLNKRTNLIAIVLVTDARHALQPFDIDMLRWVEDRKLFLLLLLNKADKLKQQEKEEVKKRVEVATATFGSDRISSLLFSAEKGTGAQSAIAILQNLKNRVLQ
jgi:GTP-binding protein